MSIIHKLGLAPLAPGTAPLGEGHAEATQFAAPGHASSALADLRLTQMRALQQRFRKDLQSVCSLASSHGSRSDGIASEAGFRAVGRHALVLAALYDELMCNTGAGPVGFASYLGRLCAWLALAELPGRTLILLAEDDGTTQGAAGSMDGDTASALGTAVADLVAAVAGYSRGDVTVQMLPPDGRGRGRLTVSAAAGPDGTGPQLGRGHDLVLAKTLIAQAGGELGRFVSGMEVGWCIRF